MSSKKWFSSWSDLEKTLGGLKFAVIVITLFTIAMIVGTFMESYYGTEFANRTVYKTWYFMLIQLAMAVSIIFAAFLRLPPKKRLYGFYTIHSGLVIIGSGSFITWYAGIDGQIVLNPNEPTREIILNDDILRITYPEKQKQVTRKLSSNAFSTQIDHSYEDIKLKTYLPYSENELQWIPQRRTYPRDRKFTSAQYFLYNDNVSQEFTVTLHPEAREFQSNLSLGPLKIRFLPPSIAKCFGLNNPSKLIIWNSIDESCFTPEQQKLKILETKTNKRFLVIKDERGRAISFLPDESPWPLKLNKEQKDFEFIQDSPFRIFSQKIFESSPNLFLFGDIIGFYDKDEEKWFTKTITKDKDIELPWMNFQVKLLRNEKELVPTNIPKYVLPIQKNGSLVVGEQKALELDIQGESYWVTSFAPLNLLINGEKVRIELIKESLILPFELVLNRFKMDKDPGTNNPASYESFVKLFSPTGPSKHHIFMNNPLKYDGFTFYQASYFQTQSGAYGSSLSANVDPGRWLKYLGSLFLVLGAIWHYYLNKRQVKNPGREELV